MKNLIFLAFFLLIAGLAKAQRADTLRGLADDTLIFAKVEHEPEFPGGIKRFWKYVAKNIVYPAIDVDSYIAGKVLVQFIVEKDGSISRPRVVRGLDDAMNNEALRVISNSPKWKPGTQNGHIVRVYYTVPIDFTIHNE